MPYSDFTLENVTAKLGLDSRPELLFPKLQAVPVPEWLTTLLSKNTLLAFISEKARSEYLISPILTAAREVSGDRLAIFSGQRLDVDASRGLTGECDFILSLAPSVPILRAPLVTVVEAKKADIELGLGQCIAEMAGAQAFNEKAGEGTRPIFGCVTSGEVWQFLKLDGKTAIQDLRRYTLSELGFILSNFREMVMQAVALTPTAAP
jgi:hypothetical protein